MLSHGKGNDRQSLYTRRGLYAYFVELGRRREHTKRDRGEMQGLRRMQE